MVLMAHMEAGNTLGAGRNETIDLESTHQVIGSLLSALQRNFKEETSYTRPLMPPQANILFMLDRDAAQRMMLHMGAKLCELGFSRDEVRFTHKVGTDGEVLQRIRLEFSEGVNAHVIQKILIATDALERVLPPYSA